MKIEYEIRWVNKNTVILWVSCGQNIFAYSNGTIQSQSVFKEVSLFEYNTSRFETLEELHTWAFDHLGYKRI